MSKSFLTKVSAVVGAASFTALLLVESTAYSQSSNRTPEVWHGTLEKNLLPDADPEVRAAVQPDPSPAGPVVGPQVNRQRRMDELSFFRASGGNPHAWDQRSHISSDFMSGNPQANATYQPAVPYGEAMRLRFGVEGLFFGRGPADDHPFISDSTGRVVSHSDLDFDIETTFRLQAEFTNDRGIGFEFNYFDFDKFSSTRTENGPDVTPVFFDGIPADPRASYDVRYFSRLKSFQTNTWFRSAGDFRFGYGLRHVKLDEEFDIIVPGGSGNDGFFSTTENKLWGGQLMAEYRRPVTKTSTFEALVNGGLYNNRMKVDALAQNIEAHESKNELATSVGFRTGMNWRMSPALNLRAGYEGLFLGNVALAPDQSKAISIFAPSNQFATGGVYTGGAYLGAMLSF